MTDHPLGRRRLLALLATGAASGLAGCNRLFTDPEGTPTSTPTPAATATPTPTATATPTAAPETPASGDVPVDIVGYEIDFEEETGDFVAADVTIRLRSEGDRSVDNIELRVAMVYAPDSENRTVVVDYVGATFDTDSISISYRTRFPSDGRADGSADPDDFALRFRVTGIEYV